MHRVAVIIPSHNHARFITEAIRSVLWQTETDLELIVVDDGSTDESLAVIRRISDPRLTVIAQSNQGAPAAINRAIAASSSPYLAILNSDDVFQPVRLEKLLAVLDGDRSIGLVGSYIDVIDADGKLMGVKHGYSDLSPWPLDFPDRSFRSGSDLHAALLTENYFATTSNFVFSRYWYLQAGVFRNLRYVHDWDFALRVAHLTSVTLVPDSLLKYRVHASNTIRENQVAMIYEICWCLAVSLPQESWHSTDSKADADQLDRLLHSIYTFGCERVLNVLLAINISENSELAVQLLNQDNPCRRTCLNFIERMVASERIERRSESKLANLVHRFADKRYGQKNGAR